ncbi:hypothetical protein E2562_031535 [Oryza meyeriana var. granulata]|uniref:Uncharacterized protein n=1 Tax=Oryza meyeriana var. granulata TaxID=110450 RepID=A0A6G1FE85_9ORYZ|nr:hypothetical protein E2562_031535 [Oryza meyeriana var. granulata]
MPDRCAGGRRLIVVVGADKHVLRVQEITWVRPPLLCTQGGGGGEELSMAGIAGGADAPAGGESLAGWQAAIGGTTGDGGDWDGRLQRRRTRGGGADTGDGRR